MKETGVCPKCGGSKVLKVDPMRCNAFPIGFTSLAKLERWFCGSCGFTEEWIQEAGVTATMKCGLFMVAAPVDRFVCCTCGYSEEWLRKSNLDDIKERWAKKPK